MISSRGPDSASADEPGIDVRAPLLRVARQTPRPLHPVSASFGGGEQPRCWPRVQSLSLWIAPFRHRYGEAHIPQARDRAEVLWGRYTPGMGHERRFPGTSVNGRPKRARNVRSRSRVRIARSLVELPERVDFSRSDANGWMATSGTNAKCKSVQ